MAYQDKRNDLSFKDLPSLYEAMWVDNRLPKQCAMLQFQDKIVIAFWEPKKLSPFKQVLLFKDFKFKVCTNIFSHFPF